MKKYPCIRLFVSSTFMDMQKERDILNLEVFPYIRGATAKLGISFTAIDLRWGITEEMQKSGDVVGLCLDEIEHSKPYFIGLIGNRYGYVPDHYDDTLKEKYPFIKGNEDKSITELEMLLGAISNTNRERSFFYYKSPSLFEDSTSDHKEDAIERLKENIEEASIKHAEYETYEEFKRLVLDDLLKAILADYPEKELLMETRQENFLSHSGSSFIPRIFMAAQAVDILAMDSRKPLFIYSSEKFGKTSTFNRLISSKEGVDKIIINMESDILAPRFPYYYLRALIEKGLNRCGYELSSGDYPDLEGDRYVICFEDNEFVNLAVLKRELLTMEYERPLYLLINDINLIDQLDNSKCMQNRFLFDENDVLPDNLHVIITTNNKNQLNRYGVSYVEMHSSLDDPKAFFKDYLLRYGKHIDDELLKSANAKLKYTDYKLIADYLIAYCNHDSYKASAADLLQKEGFLDILEYIYLDFVYRLSPKCASVLTELILRLHVFQPGFVEEDLFDSYRKKGEDNPIHSRCVELNPLEKASIMRCLRYFTYVESGVIYISSPYVRAFVAKNLKTLLTVLEKEYEARSRQKTEETFSFVDAYFAHGQAMGKEEYFSFLQEKETKMAEIRYAILDPLCEYLSELISRLFDTLTKNDPDAYEVQYCNDSYFTLLMYVQESAKLFKANTRADLYHKLLQNRDLMLFVASKSLLTIRRLIVDFIMLNRDMQMEEYGRTDDGNICFLIGEAFKSHIDGAGDLRDQLLFTVLAVLEEYSMPKNQFMEEVGEGKIFLTDFACEACSGTALENFYEDYSASFDNRGEGDASLLSSFFEKYQNAYVLFDKIYYAARFLEAAIESINAQTFKEQQQQMTTQVWLGVKPCLSYCFFPEMNALFDIFFGRIAPMKMLYKMGEGIDYLLSIGVKDSIDSHIEDYQYLLEHPIV